MRRPSTAAFALLLCLVFLPTPLLAGASKTILLVKDKANIRSGPATSYKMLWSAPKYTPLEVLCKYESWYVVRDYEGYVGWVYEPLVEVAPAVIVKEKQTVARAGPGTDKPAIWNVPRGYPLKVLGKEGKWYHVEDAEGEKAWVYEEALWGSTD